MVFSLAPKASRSGRLKISKIAVRIAEMTSCSEKQFPSIFSRRTARAYKRGNGGNGHNYRHTNADARQRKIADSLNMTDKNSVDDVIKHIYKLCRNCRQSKLKKQPANRRGAQKFFVHNVTPLLWQIVLYHNSYLLSTQKYSKFVELKSE